MRAHFLGGLENLRRPFPPSLAVLFWEHPLGTQLAVKGGPILHALHDAAQFILSLSEREKDYDEWISATERLMQAAETGEVYKATQQLEYALLKNGKLVLR
jgi:hypothetical protein